MMGITDGRSKTVTPQTEKWRIMEKVLSLDVQLPLWVAKKKTYSLSAGMLETCNQCDVSGFAA